MNAQVTPVGHKVVVAVIGAVMIVAALVAGAVLGKTASPEVPAHSVTIKEAPVGVLGSGLTVRGEGGRTGGFAVSSSGGSGGVVGH